MSKPIANAPRHQLISRGFTLTEILIVLAIVGIIAAMLLPVFAQVREKGRQATCQSNLKQIAAAVSMYVQDSDEMMPQWGGSFAPNRYITWLLDPYLKTQVAGSSARHGVWICPSRSAASNEDNSYGYNYLVLGNTTAATEPYLARYKTPALLSTLEQPAQTVAFTDAIDLVRPPYGVQIENFPDTVGSWHHSGNYAVVPQTSGAWVKGDSQARVNVLWADGHVKSLSRAVLTPPSRGGSACNDDLWDRVKPSPYKITSPSCS